MDPMQIVLLKLKSKIRNLKVSVPGPCASGSATYVCAPEVKHFYEKNTSQIIFI